MHSCVKAVLLLGCAAAAQLAAARTCPPPKWDSVKDLDLNKYVAAPWYVQQQVRGGFTLDRRFPSRKHPSPLTTAGTPL